MVILFISKRVKIDPLNSIIVKRIDENDIYVADDEVYSHHKVVNKGIVLERTFVISTCD
jgi:hypothetical protein